MTLPVTSRRGFLALAATAAVTPVSRASTPHAPPLYITSPRPFPPFGFSDASGHRPTLENFRGRFVLLNIWATCCIPCRKEMPALDDVQAKLGGPHFEVVPVSIDTGGLKAVKSFYAKIEIRHLGIFLDLDGSAMRALNLEGVPTSFLIDPNGRHIGRETGAVAWDKPHVLAFLRGTIAAHLSQ